MNACDCGQPTELLLCPKCESQIARPMLAEARRQIARLRFLEAKESDRQRRNKRARQLRQLKKIKQRPLEFTE